MQVLEGTWEEIEARKAELVGHRLRVIVEDDEPASQELDPRWQRFIGAVEAPTPTDAAHMEQRFRPEAADRGRAFREWAESHRRDLPLLSDEAISRESI